MNHQPTKTMLHKAIKIIIITEQIISKGVCQIIEDSGATGYTTVAAGGRGSRDKRSTSERTSVVDDFANIKIEVIVHDKALAESITDQVVTKYFQNYSGITYIEEVEILRPGKFWEAE